MHSDSERKSPDSDIMIIDKKPLLCQMCSFACYDARELHEHSMSHSEADVLNRIIIAQVKSDVAETFYACQICDFMSAGERQLEEHYKTQHPINSNRQVVTNSQLNNNTSLVNSQNVLGTSHLRPIMPTINQPLPLISGFYACSICGLLCTSLENVQIHYQTHHLEFFQTLVLQQIGNGQNSNQSVAYPSTIMLSQPTQPLSTIVSINSVEVRPKIRKIAPAGQLPFSRMPFNNSKQATLSQPFMTPTHVPIPNSSSDSTNCNASHPQEFNSANISQVQKIQVVTNKKNNNNNNISLIPINALEIPSSKIVNIFACGLCSVKINDLDSMLKHMQNNHNHNNVISNHIIREIVGSSNRSNETKQNVKNFKSSQGKLKQEVNQNSNGRILSKKPDEHINSPGTSTLYIKESNCELDRAQGENTISNVNSISSIHKSEQLDFMKDDESIYLQNASSLIKSHKRQIEQMSDLLIICDVCGYAEKNFKLMKFHLQKNHKMEGSCKTLEIKQLSVEDIKIIECHLNSKRHNKVSRELGYKKIGFLCQVCSFYSDSHIRISMHSTYVHKQEDSFNVVGVKVILQHENLPLTFHKNSDLKNSGSVNIKLANHFGNKCQQCEEVFPSSGKFRKHLLNASHVLVCHFCSFNSKKPKIFAFHCYKKHNVPVPDNIIKKAHKCPNCPYISISYNRIMYHIRFKHQEDRKYQCNSCCKTFTTQLQYDSHWLVHQQVRPFACSQCSYGAFAESHLQKHIRFKHSLEKLYQCPFCDYKSAVRSCIVPHLKSRHTIQIYDNANVNKFIIKDNSEISQEKDKKILQSLIKEEAYPHSEFSNENPEWVESISNSEEDSGSSEDITDEEVMIENSMRERM